MNLSLPTKVRVNVSGVSEQFQMNGYTANVSSMFSKTRKEVQLQSSSELVASLERKNSNKFSFKRSTLGDLSCGHTHFLKC